MNTEERERYGVKGISRREVASFYIPNYWCNICPYKCIANSMREGSICLYSLLCLQHLEQCLALRRYQ